MSTNPEPWLRGTHTDLPAVIRAVIHALELCSEDAEKACASLDAAALHARPAGIAPVAFHLLHIVRSLDRLLTYAEGRELSTEQLAALRTELAPAASKAEVLAEFRRGMEGALQRVRSFAAANLEQPRAVGRKALPTSIGGLLVHCADHTQRHTGQAVTSARIVAGSVSG